jgi:DtxR family transcriptional regulator, Mn-dependent transcriptional regulator
MKLSPTMEAYLEVIYLLSEEGVGARLSDIAEKVGVTKASANRAMVTLSNLSFIRQERYKEVHLTPEGLAYANTIFHKHNVIKQFFIEILQIDADLADKEACKIEHVISSDSILAMQRYVNNATTGNTPLHCPDCGLRI